jgi:hypothetical protein
VVLFKKSRLNWRGGFKIVGKSGNLRLKNNIFCRGKILETLFAMVYSNAAMNRCSVARGRFGLCLQPWGQQYHGVVDSSLRQVVLVLR